MRDRLAKVFDDLWTSRLGLVVAPAGFGKTTLLAHLAEHASVPVAWYRAEDSDASGGDLLPRLQHAFGRALGTTAPAWESLEDALAGLEAVASPRILLVVDDLHTLAGTDAEELLEQLVNYAPPALAVLVASRVPPRWNLSRRRVTGELTEISGEDLRFRSWEVEQLFRDHYARPLAPEDLAVLTRVTEGWAAGLQLFHLATREKSVAEQRRTMASLNSGLRLVREYLVRNVLDELPRELQAFLVETCVLGRLNSQICDELRGRRGSLAILEDLERRQLLARSVDGSRWFRCHEVLRGHLETAYLEAVTEDEARSRYRWAGSLLESAGAPSDALRAYCRAEDWEAAGRLLGHKGPELSDGPVQWVGWLPSALVEQDPWLLLAEARRHRAAGRPAAALDAYSRAAEAMPSAGASQLCRRERASLAAWLEAAPAPVTDWSGTLRRAVGRGPMVVCAELRHAGDPHALFVAGMAALVAGCPATASPLLGRVVDHASVTPVLAGSARVALGVAALLSGGDPLSAVQPAADHLEELGLTGLTRLARAVSALPDAAAARVACEHDGDLWGQYTVALLQGWARLGAGGGGDARLAAGLLGDASAGFDRLGAFVPSALARSLETLALARAGNPGARSSAVRAETTARAVGSPGAQALATLALSECDPGNRALADEAARLLRWCGLAVPAAPAPPASATPERGPEPSAPLAIRCFRSFAVHVDGRPVDLSTLKPRARKVLRLLALQCPDWTHREVLIEAIWPGGDPAAGARNLQVAISSLRHALEPHSARGGSLIARQGDAYRLALPEGAWVDHVQLSRTLARARAAGARGDTGQAKADYAAALALAPGLLLPEDGPADWVVAAREHYRAEISRAAQSLAELLVDEGDFQAAVDVAERALALDRWSDGLWRVLVDANEAAGDLAAAARAQQGYADVLAGLGVSSDGERAAK